MLLNFQTVKRAKNLARRAAVAKMAKIVDAVVREAVTEAPNAPPDPDRALDPDRGPNAPSDRDPAIANVAHALEAEIDVALDRVHAHAVDPGTANAVDPATANVVDPATANAADLATVVRVLRSKDAKSRPSSRQKNVISAPCFACNCRLVYDLVTSKSSLQRSAKFGTLGSSPIPGPSDQRESLTSSSAIPSRFLWPLRSPVSVSLAFPSLSS
jgi:hypothetical protein